MNNDLIHFLRLGLMRIRHRAAELSPQQDVSPEAALAAKSELETLKILEDLILEQVPYENIDHSAR